MEETTEECAFIGWFPGQDIKYTFTIKLNTEELYHGIQTEGFASDILTSDFGVTVPIECIWISPKVEEELIDGLRISRVREHAQELEEKSYNLYQKALGTMYAMDPEVAIRFVEWSIHFRLLAAKELEGDTQMEPERQSIFSLVEKMRKVIDELLLMHREQERQKMEEMVNSLGQ